MKSTKLLIHIGYGKSGSTFLQRWFGNNPYLCYFSGQGSRSDIFDRFTLHYKIPDCLVLSNERLTVSLPIKYPGVIYKIDFDMKKFQKTVAEILSNVFQTARIFIVTRGYKSILKSTYSQYIRMGGTCSFKKYLLQNKKLLLEFFDYNHEIRIFEDFFGRENMLILPFEVLKENEDKFLSKIERFLDIPKFRVKLGRLNPSFDEMELYWYPQIARLIPWVFCPWITGREYPSEIPLRYFFKIYRSLIRLSHSKFLTRLMSLIKRGKIIDEEWYLKYIEEYRGKADLLNSIPEYTPYRKEYLIEK